MSPEQASGKPVDGRSDVYAIGVVLYQLLTRRLPFQADSSMEMVAAHVHRTPEPLPERIPRPLAAVVERALAKHPADRPHSAAGFAAELSRALVDSGLRGHRPTPQPAGPIASFNTVTFERVPMVETAGAMPVAPVGPDTPDSVPRPPSRPVARPRLGAKLALAAVVLLGGAGLAVWQPWASPQSVVPAVAPAASTAPAAQAQAARAEAEPMRLAAQAEPEAEPERAPEPEPPTPMIELVTVPPGATVREGTRVLGVTPLHVARPPEGRVRALVIEAPGRRPAAVALERSADAVLQLSLHEVAQPATPTVQPSPQRPRRTRAKREPTGVEPVAASPPPAAPAEPAPAPEEKAPATVEGLSIME